MALLKQLSSAFTGTAVIFCGLIVHKHLFKVNTDMKYFLSIYADRKKKVQFKCSCGTLKPTVTGTAVSFCGLIVHIHIIKVNTDMKYLLSIYADRKKKVHFKCSCGTLKPTVKCIHRNCCQFLWFNCSHTHIQSKY